VTTNFRPNTEATVSFGALSRDLCREGRIDALALVAATAAVPVSIAVSEGLLFVALVSRLIRILRRRAEWSVPRVFWFWLAWAGLELVIWATSPEPHAGRGEISHLLLLGSLFVVMPAFAAPAWSVMAWRGLLLTASLGSLFLIGDVISRLIYYQRELSVDPDPSLYLRTGGLLNHWMVFGTVEVVVFAAILAFSHTYPERRQFWIPVLVLNAIAVVLSLTRMVWVCCFVLLEIDLFWRRSRWRWASALLPVALFAFGPGFLRARVRTSMQPGYYANAERIQMLRVGWKMVKEHPFRGVGPGRVEELYRHYLQPADPVPAYYGHLHNNIAQLAAEFGVPVAVAALVVFCVLFLDIRKAWKAAPVDRDKQFLCRAGALGLAAFALAGMFDYTYGHSLGLIIVTFASLAPILTKTPSESTM
jgi:O-antigen ligase